MENNGWYGFDLDACIAYYDHYRGDAHIGEPIWPMVNLMRKFIADGRRVKIFTARVSPAAIVGRNPSIKTQEGIEKELTKIVQAIVDWSLQNIGSLVPITATKDYEMITCYDDRCIQIVPNEGRRADGLPL